ncbi:MAG: restriction endonuclease subunit S [Candidatus Competibacter sp.]|nr:restriction endonuclease subunit S [Candidatus Competibacter sp.]
MKELQELPVGWRWVHIKEICELNPRRPAIDRSDSMPTTFVPMEAVDDVMGKMDTSATRPYSVVKKGYTYFQEGDVVFSKITPCMQNGKHAIAHGLLDGIAFGTTEFHIIRPGPKIDAHWLHSYLRRPEILREAERHFTGAVGQRRVPISFLEELEIPLPPLPEQKRIAAILTERLAAVERARLAAEEQLKQINNLPASLLRQAFSGSL